MRIDRYGKRDTSEAPITKSEFSRSLAARICAEEIDISALGVGAGDSADPWGGSFLLHLNSYWATICSIET